MHRLLAAIAIWAWSATAGAQETWYDVELIVFARADQKYADSEVWPTEVAPLPLERITPLLPPAGEGTDPVPFQRLPEEALLLRDEHAKMAADPLFEPLLHVGWRQPGLAREQAVAVRFDAAAMDPLVAGEVDPAAVTADATAAEQPAADAAAPEAAPDETAPYEIVGVAEAAPELLPLPRLEGHVRLILSRYLHLETDLRYRTPAQTIPEPTLPAEPFDLAADALPLDETVAAEVTAEDPAPAAATADGEEPALDALLAADAEAVVEADLPPIYLLRDSRRMRSRELHYIDHPMFGLLVQVTPYEPPKPAEAPPDEAVTAPAVIPAPVVVPASKPAVAKPAGPAMPVDPNRGGVIRR